MVFMLSNVCGDFDQDDTSNDDASNNEELNDTTGDAIGEFEEKLRLINVSNPTTNLKLCAQVINYLQKKISKL